MEFPFEFISNSPADTEKCGELLANELKNGDFVAFFGTLGAGKTAFVRGMARILAPEAYVQSPTYTIVNEYKSRAPLFHFDMYRISDEDDLYSAGYDDYFMRNGIFAVEWSENVPFAIPEKHYRVTIEKTGEDTRKITIEKNL